jgi:SulP family sulfate permease
MRMNRPGRAAVVAALDGAAVSVPMTLGGSLILYGQIAPQWLGSGVLAGCLGYAIAHAAGAAVRRPVVCAARFFEAATLAAMVMPLAANLPAWGVPDTPATRVALAILVTTLAGLLAGLLWLLRAERFVRFVPAPVYVGFTSALVGLILLTQLPSLLRQVERAGHPWPALLAAFVVAAGLAVRRWRPSLPPAACALALGSLVGAGLLAGGVPVPMLTEPATWTLPVVLADFAALAAPGAHTLAIALAVLRDAAVLAVLLFLNTVVTGQMLAQTDDRTALTLRDRLFQSLALAGAGSVGSAPVSGAPNVALIVARTRGAIAGPTMLLTMAATALLLQATQALAVVPLAALVGVFFFDAWQMWDRPTVRNAVAWVRRQPLPAQAREDLLLIAAVTAASLLVNMVAALFVGLVLGLLLHAHRNTRRPIRSVWTGRQLHSNCARSRDALALLDRHGERILGFELDGQQFFASAAMLGAGIRSRLADVDVVVLDWSAVRDIDTSIANVVGRLEANAAARGVALLHAGVPEASTLRAALAPLVSADRVADDLDHGLEQAENRVIERYRGELPTQEGVSEAGLLRGLDSDERALVLGCMQPRNHAAGETLLRQGDPADELLVLVEGSASVVLPRPGAPALRLSGVRDGTTIGEIGFLDRAARSADVVADTSVRLLVLTRTAFDELAAQHPRVMQRLLTNLSLDLAARVRHLSSRLASRVGV